MLERIADQLNGNDSVKKKKILLAFSCYFIEAICFTTSEDEILSIDSAFTVFSIKLRKSGGSIIAVRTNIKSITNDADGIAFA